MYPVARQMTIAPVTAQEGLRQSPGAERVDPEREILAHLTPTKTAEIAEVWSSGGTQGIDEKKRNGTPKINAMPISRAQGVSRCYPADDGRMKRRS